MDRRRLLTTLAAGGLAVATVGLLDACTGGSANDRTTKDLPSAPPAPDPRATAAEVERSLFADATAVIEAHPDLTRTVGPVRDAHARHITALVGEVPSTTASATASVTSTASSSADAVGAGTSSAALLRLASRERSGARLHAANAERDTVGGTDARLIASLSAYAAAQDVVLTEAAR